MNKKLITAILFGAAAVSVAAFAGCNIGENNGVERHRQDNMCFDIKADGTYELTRYEYAELGDREEDDGTVTEGYKGEGETVTVPDKVIGRAVTSIKSGAFSGCGVKEVTLPSVITALPDGIFSGCTLLKKVNFSTVTSVGDGAFHSCESLESIEFKSGLTQIDDDAFAGCTKLATVTLPDTVVTIGDGSFRNCAFESINTAAVETIGATAFYQCGNLTSFDMSNVVSIGNGAFYNCANLTSLDMPDVVSIGENAFEGCDKLTQLSIGDKLEKCQSSFKKVTNVSINSPLPEEIFMWNEAINEVTLGEGVTSIGRMAFGYCYGLKSITLPSTLTELSDSAFNQSGLTGTLNIPASVKTIGTEAFYNCNIGDLTIENGVESIGASAFERCRITSLSLPASVKTLGDKAFMGCNQLKTITFSEGLESIGSQSFTVLGDEALEIVLPSTVKSLGDSCFGSIAAKKLVINETVETVGNNILKGCKVRELTVPATYGHNASAVETLTLFGEGDIPMRAYYNCNTLKTVNLSSGVKSIGASAFAGLQKINLSGVESIGESALGDISELTYTKTENGVNYIDNWIISSDYSNGGATQVDLSGLTGVYEHAFKKTVTNDTSALTTVFLTDPDGASTLKQIGRYAFEGTGITGVQIPASLDSWNYAFAGCERLNAISFDKGVEKIANGAFIGCTNLSGFNFANTDITEVGEYAFSGCTNMRLITLPNGIKKIGDYAFRNCSSLLSADLKSTEEIGRYAFGSCSSLGEVIMNSVKTIGYTAFSGCRNLTEIDLTASVTKIEYGALGYAETVNFAGTADEWQAIDKYMYGGKIDIWSPLYSDGVYRDLKIVFADGSSITYSKNESNE